ncbi:hypothetical protein [Paracraurococcus ruber]|uniref:Uncharacterized protein n=1 Tax=Paracraurococcus ruber TaxID=77675 RepID=A0ABS1D910_9PROT|nr:hypothetical protein [Paracraurococcus ruber]MBK1662552.1 hypothetical protein [Paracraurococcus ruber]TDG23002.1 hypothetical protein E2C05_26585 [Paracraurococcus ruber]
MDLGTRSIRSAGLGSGSIEVTLPASLRALQGLPCRIALRDGHRPEIALTPDLGPARAAFARLAALLDDALGLPPAPLGIADFTLSLHSHGAAAPRPRLAWADGLALVAPPPQAMDAVARTLRGLGQHAAGRLGLADTLAPGFGAALAWAVTGRVADAADQPACDIAAAALAEGGITGPAGPDGPANGFDPALWAQAAPRLRRLLALHQDWSTHPQHHAAYAEAWRRGVACELSGE